MSGLGMNLEALRRYRQRWEQLSQGITMEEVGARPGQGTRLTEVRRFGSNPGALRMKCYVPAAALKSIPLVVVLHGCQQDAEAYDRGTGWTRLADAAGFAVLYPEQQAANNPKNCFSWFQPGDTRRGAGEALSIRQMIDAMVMRHDIDKDRVFITGLSAGGAMTSVMLATYPEVFAGGAIIAGLPYGAARTVQQAFEAMFKGANNSGKELGGWVRAASTHRGPWPRVSIWHGTADTTVVPSNARETLKQWLNVHSLPDIPSAEDRALGYRRRQWCDAEGKTLVEDWIIDDLPHGTPLDAQGGAEFAGPYLLDAGISSTWHIARFWDLTAEMPPSSAKSCGAPKRRHLSPAPEAGPSGVQATITKALKAAGLLR
ncbi:LpqC, poly [Agaricicola taiwanensis]|uniref:LpqC, poly n=1 Tax=Agaricicola taiwanensis TaxID=591372 RepID=A0A8J2VNM5_9RHOB|nr:PHB depolymerase family esterase [Agaricicola taiwanensis]GGE34137.1 LpqC, poly [Agaricicola taiwanensis]